MGAGSYSTATYASSAATRALAGTSDMGYHDDVLSYIPRSEWKTHQTLEPFEPDGASLRESRDSVEHPNSIPIAFFCDVTGSMAGFPRVMQQKMPELFEMLLLKGYAVDPQTLFGAVGDVRAGDACPLQVSQFESDNRNDENISNLALVGGGGGGNHESYELVFYYMARHTAHDAIEKRGKKGYLFLYLDEECYLEVRPQDVKQVIGDDIDAPIPLDDIIAECQEKYEVFIIIPESHSRHCEDFWRQRFGQNVMLLRSAEAICTAVALKVGLEEGTVTDTTAALADLNLDEDTSRSVARAITP